MHVSKFLTQDKYNDTLVIDWQVRVLNDFLGKAICQPNRDAV